MAKIVVQVLSTTFTVTILYMQYGNLVKVICQGLPDVSRCPLESDDHLIAADEQARKKQVLKDRKKVGA